MRIIPKSVSDWIHYNADLAVDRSNQINRFAAVAFVGMMAGAFCYRNSLSKRAVILIGFSSTAVALFLYFVNRWVKQIQSGEHCPSCKEIQELKNESFHYIVLEGYLDAIKYQLAHNADVNAIEFRDDDVGYAPLHDAARLGDLQVVQLLLEKGANRNIETINGPSSKQTFTKYTPLHFAAWSNHLDIVQCLQQSGANLEATDSATETPLHTAARFGHLEIVKELVGNGANLQAVNRKKQTPLLLAYYNGWNEVVDYLATGINQNLQDAAFVWKEALDINTLEHYLAQGANINGRDRLGRGALHYAVNRPKEMIEAILEKAPNLLHSIDNEGNTPFHFAESARSIAFLIGKGMDINADNQLKQKPLNMALQECKLEAAKALLNNGARVNPEGTNQEGQPSIHGLIWKIFIGHRSEEARKDYLHRWSAVLEKVLEQDPEMFRRKDHKGQEVLHIAIRTNQSIIDSLPFFLEHGADIDAKDGEGLTPLLLAGSKCYMDICAFLINNGANKDMTDKDGKAYFELSQEAEKTRSEETRPEEKRRGRGGKQIGNGRNQAIDKHVSSKK